MKIMFHLEHGQEKISNFNLAEALVNLCDEDYNHDSLNAEVVAKMILLQIEAREGGADNG